MAPVTTGATGLGFAVYVAGRNTLRSVAPASRLAAAPTGVPTSLSRGDWLVLLGLALLLPVLALDSVGNMEILDGYLLWAKQHYDLQWFGLEMPVSWLLSLDALEAHTRRSGRWRGFMLPGDRAWPWQQKARIAWCDAGFPVSRA